MRTLTLTGMLVVALALSAGEARAQPTSSASGAVATTAPPASATTPVPAAKAASAKPATTARGASSSAKAASKTPAKKKPPVARKAGNKNTGHFRASPNKKPRAAGPPHAPDPAARRAVAGVEATTERRSASVDTPELEALHAAERELFQPDTQLRSPGVSPAFPASLVTSSGAPRVYASGLPPPSVLAPDRADGAMAQADWLSKLALPDLPVRWNERLVQYLEFYKSDPRGRAIAAIWYKKSGAYEPMLRAILRENKVPEDLLWVAVIESGLRPTVYSAAGAAGLWQFMPDTGKLYGLVIDRWVDERLDPVRSTQAAARYLYDLHRRFGTWELALAAYNMGFGGLLTTIRKYNSNDYWDLSRFEAGLPWETTLYVPKILALAVMARNPAEFGLDGLQREAPLAFDEVDVAPGVSLSSIADAAGVALDDVEQLNPQLLASRVPPRVPNRSAAGAWPIRVPQGRAGGVTANLVRARSREPRVDTVVIRQGESLADLARSRSTSERQIEQLNALRPDEVPRPGTVLVVPVAPPAASPRPEDKPVVVVAADLASPAGTRRVFYRVVPGDTLAGIANALSVRADEIRRWNALDPMARLHEGMTLLALVPKTRDLSQVLTWTDDDVKVLVAGSDEFFSYFEGLKDRVRTTIVVKLGDTWKTIARRTGLSVGMLERINRRARSDGLQPGERLVVYLPARSATRSGPAAPSGDDDEPKAPLEPPCPDDLPPLPDSPAVGVQPAGTDTAAPSDENGASGEIVPASGCVRPESG